MKHVSDIKLSDLVVGPFFCQLSSRLNQFLYVGSSLWIAHREWKALYGTFDFSGVLLYGSLTLAYICMIVMAVFLMTAAFGVIGSMTRSGVLGKRSFEFRDDSFVEKSELSESVYPYSSIEKVFKRMGAIYISLPGMNWQILPRRDFASKGEWDKLYNFLESKVAGRPAVALGASAAEAGAVSGS